MVLMLMKMKKKKRKQMSDAIIHYHALPTTSY